MHPQLGISECRQQIGACQKSQMHFIGALSQLCWQPIRKYNIPPPFHFIFQQIVYAILVIFQHIYRWCPLRLLQFPVGDLNLHQKLNCIASLPPLRVSVSIQLTCIQLEERTASFNIANLCVPATNPCFRCASCTGDIMPPITLKAPRSIK